MLTYVRENFDYFWDMLGMMNYLNKVGTVNVLTKTMEKLYKESSNDYWCADWARLSSKILQDFANFLSDYEV